MNNTFHLKYSHLIQCEQKNKMSAALKDHTSLITDKKAASDKHAQFRKMLSLQFLSVSQLIEVGAF